MTDQTASETESSARSRLRDAWTARPPGSGTVLTVLLAIVFAAALVVLGSAELAKTDQARWNTSYFLSDGRISLSDQETALRRFAPAAAGEEPSARQTDDDAENDPPKRCDLARENYAFVTSSGISLDAIGPRHVVPDHRIVVVQDGTLLSVSGELTFADLERTNDIRTVVISDGSVEVGETEHRTVVPEAEVSENDPRLQTCIVLEERRSGPAGLTVLLTALLGGVAMLAMPISWRMASNTVDGLQLANFVAPSAVALLLGFLTIVVAGIYRFEIHLLMMLVALMCVVVPTTLVLFVAKDGLPTAADDTRSDAEALEQIRSLRADTRTALLILSILFSLSVGLVASLNARFLEWRGELVLKVMNLIELGGFGEEDLGTVTTIESALFAAILIAVAAPAIWATERRGRDLLEELWAAHGSSHASAGSTKPGEPDELSKLVKRDEAATKLGLLNRPIAWIESGIALLLPLATGASADLLGLLG